MSQRPMPLFIAVALAGSFACTTSAEAPAAEAAPAEAEQPEMAIPPFSAQQIRDATPVGRTYRFRIARPGETTLLREMTFSRVDAEGCTIESTLYGDAGAAVGETTSTNSTWEELVGHASYPAETTVVTDVPCTVPAGVFRCKLYTFTDSQEGVDSVTRAYFATTLPGAPIKLEVTAGGKPVTTWTLVEHQPSVARGP